jgi:hypothetical protein
MWMLGDDGEIEVNLQKMKKGDTWECALLGHGQVVTRSNFDPRMEPLSRCALTLIHCPSHPPPAHACR